MRAEPNAAGLSYGVDDAGGAQERRATGGSNTAARVSAKHQSLLLFVGQVPWSDEALMGRFRDWTLPRMIERGGPIRAWIIDDTGFPKKGKHSVGVQPTISVWRPGEGPLPPKAWTGKRVTAQADTAKQRSQTALR